MSLKVKVILVLLALFSQAIAQNNVIHISPSAESPCPVSVCLTLSECAQNVTKCFVSNTTLMFLRGRHMLEAIIVIRDVTNIALIGESSSLPEVTTEIRFNEVATLWFKVVIDVQIHALSFSNSKTFLSEVWTLTILDCIFQHSENTALTASNVTVYFERVSFSGNLEGGMVAYNSTLIFRGGINFTSNSAGKTGGGLSVDICAVTFSGWNSFTNNSAGTDGGGVYSTHSTLNFSGIITFTHNTAAKLGGGFLAFHSTVVYTNTTFLYNSAEYGGGISSINSNLTFRLSNFTLNKAVVLGGAFSAIHNRVVFLSNITFFKNSAKHGGAISCQSMDVNFTGDSTFINNSAVGSGGGIDATYSSLIFSGKNIFTQNTAYEGGAIFTANVTARFHGESRFISNSARYSGGANYVSSHSSLIFNGNNTFLNNSAVEFGGGGIVARGSSTLEFNGISNFTNNAATSRGGGIEAEESTVIFSGEGIFMHNLVRQFNGGVFFAQNSVGIFNGSNSFVNNLAGYGGGGVSGNSDSVLDFHGVSNFTNNSAELGGGLLGENCTIVFYGSTAFVHNSAKYSGGGLVIEDVTVIFYGDSVFTHNTAGTSGGGVATFANSTLDFGSYNSFINNSAALFGGGIYADHSNAAFNGKSIFAYNYARRSGGGLYAQNNTGLSFRGDSIFNRNFAELIGGGMAVLNIWSDLKSLVRKVTVDARVENSNKLIFSGNIELTHNTAGYEGGGLAFFNISGIFSGESYFTGNTASYIGGGLWLVNSTVVFSGKNTFVYNSAVNSGGGMAMFRSSNVVFCVNNTFTHNSAENGGGFVAVNCSFTFHGTTVFANNTAERIGGGLLAKNCSGLFRGDNSFLANSAGNAGGGVSALLDSNIEFCGNTSFMENIAGYFGGGINAGDSRIVFRENSNFISNAADVGGGAVYPVGSFLTFIGTTSFKQNFANAYGGAIFSIFQPFGIVRSAVMFNGTMEFMGNVAGNGGGALALWNYTVIFIGRSTFSHNKAKSGGALIGSTPTCYLFPNTSVHFESNHATQRGGAVNHLDDPFYDCFLLSRLFKETKLLIPCFFRIPEERDPQIELVFNNNTAGEAGDSLYGGAIDSCLTYSINGNRLGYDMFDSLSTITNNNSTSSVSSDPFRICACINNQPDFNSVSIERETYPGATFLISAVGVGQRNGTVPAVIRAELGLKSHAKIDELEKAQEIEQHCSSLHYTVYSPAALEEINLYAEGSCPRLGDPLTVFVKLRECPAGFMMSERKNACVCEERLQKYTTSCNITDATIEHSGNLWVGYSNRSSGLILHPHCPFDYCTTETIRFTLADSDKQCRYNRTGLLCGACKPGLSFALATSECMKCSNSHLSLLLAFALAGIILVIFLFACKLTVSVGTLNGLIFYANIVAINHSIFFPNGDKNILTVFIAWINLDLGIKTCLYDGMDAYARTWLQFVFPAYIWTLVGVIIIASYYSTKIARLLTGTNPVSVLATLFLLSYAKLLRTIIAVLSFTSLEYPNNSRVIVWLSDGNIEYFHGKHIPLALVALVLFLLFFLSFTLLLFFGQWMQANSTRKCFSWACDPRVKAVLDAYYGPFNDDTRYWTGLLLLLRCALFLVLACNILGNPSVDLLAISASMLGLEVVMRFTGDIYKNRYLDILESSFILNLGILTIGTYQVKVGGGNQVVLSCTSVGTAFATFIGIIFYHVHLRLKSSRPWKALQHYFDHGRRWVEIPTEDTMEDSMHNSEVPQNQSPTVTFINLREPLELISSCND